LLNVVLAKDRQSFNETTFLSQGDRMTGKRFWAALWSVLLVVGFEWSYCALALADPTGVWLAKDGARVTIAPCGDGLCGVLTTTKSATDPETGAPWTDKHNINPAQRDRPLVGVAVLIGMHPDGAGWWIGHLYNVDDGKTYFGKLNEIDARTVRVEGCVGLICGGDNMTRIK
jgi:uncharacterized protein (DUF2147 family)